MNDDLPYAIPAKPDARQQFIDRIVAEEDAGGPVRDFWPGVVLGLFFGVAVGLML